MASPQSELLYASIQHSRPDRCVRLSHNPSIHVYYALKSKIENSDQAWLEEFLQLDGLDSLLDSLALLSGKIFMNISDSVLQLDCIACVKAILNTRPGLQFVVRQDSCVRKLTSALNTPNILPKKQIFELLTAVAIHSKRGHTLVLEALQHLAKETCESHQFSLVLRELKKAETSPHKCSLLAFINTLLGCGEDVRQRCRTRDQFIALGLLDLLRNMSRDDKDSTLAVQLEVFEEQKHKDEDLLSKQYKLDVGNSSDIFSELSSKLTGRPEAVDFLHILQDLYLLETTNNDRSLLWQTMSKTMHHITSLSSKEETDSFLQNLNSLVSPHNSVTYQTTVNPKTRNDKTTLSHKSSSGSTLSHQGVHWREADEIITCSPDFGTGTSSDYSRRDSGISVTSQCSPYPFDGGVGKEGGFKRQGSQRGSFRKVPQLEKVQEGVMLSCGPVPHRPVKPVKWVKVPAKIATREMSLWRQLRMCSSDCVKLDFDSLEEEFGDAGGIQDADDELELLSGDKTLALNMFLARLEVTPEELASCVQEAEDTVLDLGALRSLMKILPTEEEIAQLRSYRGPRFDLAPAEQFILSLSDIPDYRTLLEGMLFKAEFNSKVGRLRTSLQGMSAACRDILHCPGLRDFVRVMLEAGNFLNSNSVYSNAGGVKLNTWRSLVSVKGKTHRVNLLERIVRQLEKHNEESLLFIDDFPTLEQAASQSFETLKTEVTQLNDKLKKLLPMLAASNQTVRDMFELFIEDVKQDLQQLHDTAARVRSLSNQMALYFCEEETTFDLQACFKDLLDFCGLVKQCQKTGQLARQQKQAADKQKDRLEEERINKQVARLLRNKIGMCSSFVTKQTDGVLDQLLSEVQRGNCQRFLGNELTTPDEEENPLLVSHIAPEVETLDGTETPFTLSLNEIRQGSNVKTYADRADAYILPQYRREKQIKTSSYVLTDPSDLNPPRLRVRGREVNHHQAMPESPEIFKVKFYPKLSELNDRPTTLNLAKKKTHKRSNSDLDRSTVVEEKWKRYERQIAKAAAEERQNPKKPESAFPLVALGLENKGHLLQRDEMDIIVSSVDAVEQRVINLDQNVEGFGRGKKKRSSFGMLKRLVLGRRDSNIPETKPGEKDAKNKHRKSKKGENNDFIVENFGADKPGKITFKGNGRRLSTNNKENAV